MRAAASLAFLAFLAAPALAAPRYEVADAGGFAQPYMSVEHPMMASLADDYGWKTYSSTFTFSLVAGKGGISRDSTLELTLFSIEGQPWSYTCRNRPREWATRVALFLNHDVHVFITCYISPSRFAELVHAEEAAWVGQPTLEFEAVLSDGKARAGSNKGLYLQIPESQIASSRLGRHNAASLSDPEAVIFASFPASPAKPARGGS